MKKMKLGFFMGMAMMAFPLFSDAQSNTLGDRGPEAGVEQSHRIQKQHITRKQKLLFRKPNVRHSAQYEYYKRVEEMAREKQAIARKQMKFNTTTLPHEAEYQFYKRVELVAKNKQVMLRKMAKPQYSDFSYFGHKHPPKKHLPYAMRYCKECGLRH